MSGNMCNTTLTAILNQTSWISQLLIVTSFIVILMIDPTEMRQYNEYPMFF